MKSKFTLRNFLILFVLTLTFSCKTTITPTATFVEENKEEAMPVWIHGNEDSKYIILAVHGGPGSNVLDFRDYMGGKGFRKLEEDYLVVYWQQRASGQSKGSNNNNFFTIAQYVEDADKVIDDLKKRYPNKEIVLFGHSWGGMLTSAYLKDSERRKKVVAWIDAAGVHNGTNLLQSTIADINNEADKRIEANENVDYWKDVKEKLSKKPKVANKLSYEVLNEIPEVKTKVDMSQFGFTVRAILSNKALFAEILKTDNTPALANFNLPILLLWGEYDFSVSKTLRAEVIANIPVKATSISFPAAGHYIMFHQPDLFATSIKDFIESLD